MFKDKFYDKIDGVAMGYILKFYIRRADSLIYYILVSPLAPVLANLFYGPLCESI